MRQFVPQPEIVGYWNRPIYTYRYQYRVNDTFRYLDKYRDIKGGTVPTYIPTVYAVRQIR